MNNISNRLILIIAALFLLTSLHMSAQESGGRKGFSVNELSLGGGFYNDGYESRPVYAATYLLGRHFNQHLYGGISATCSFSTFYAGYIYQGSRVYDHSFGFRILVHGRYYFLENQLSPYVGVDLGGAHIPGYEESLSPYTACQLGLRWILDTHHVLGFNIGPGICTKGYKEVLFRLTYEFR